MKHETSRDTFAIISVFAIINDLADLASEALFLSRAVANLDDPASIGLASIMRRWHGVLIEASEALDDRTGLRYFVAPADREAPGPFTWIVADDASSRVVAHGVADDWSEADAAAIAAIAEMEASA